METGNKEIHSYTVFSITGKVNQSTSGLVGAYLCSTEHSASWKFCIHSSGSSKRDVMYLTVRNSESDLEESDTAVLFKRHYHLHVNVQIYYLFEGLSKPVVGLYILHGNAHNLLVHNSERMTSICILIGLQPANRNGQEVTSGEKWLNELLLCSVDMNIDLAFCR